MLEQRDVLEQTMVLEQQQQMQQHVMPFGGHQREAGAAILQEKTAAGRRAVSFDDGE